MPNKWTPGPWYVEGFEDLPGDIRVLAKGAGKYTPGECADAIVAVVSDDNCTEDRQQVMACAHLMAAAPALYEALEAVEQNVDADMGPCPMGWAQVLGKVRKALSAARGEEVRHD